MNKKGTWTPNRDDLEEILWKLPRIIWFMYIKSENPLSKCTFIGICLFVCLCCLADLNRRESKAERGLLKEIGLYEDLKTEQKGNSIVGQKLRNKCLD